MNSLYRQRYQIALLFWYAISLAFHADIFNTHSITHNTTDTSAMSTDPACSSAFQQKVKAVVMKNNVLVRFLQVQVVVLGKVETTTIVYWVTDRIDCCHIGFLPCDIMMSADCYDVVLTQIIGQYPSAAENKSNHVHEKTHKNARDLQRWWWVLQQHRVKYFINYLIMERY